MKRYLRMSAPLALLGLLALGGCSLVKLDVTAAVGDWTGELEQRIERQAGTANMTITQDTAAKTLMVLDLNGLLFGSSFNPTPQTIVGTYTDSAVTVDDTTPLFNAITMSVNILGTISGKAHPAGFDSVTFAGTFSSTSIIITYTIYDAPDTEYGTGTLIMSKK